MAGQNLYVRPRRWFTVLLLLVMGGITLVIAPDEQIRATDNMCIQVLQTYDSTRVFAPPLSSLYQLNLQTQEMEKTVSLDGMPPKAIAPNRQYAVYWKALEGTDSTQSFELMGMYLYSAQDQKSTLLTTLNAFALSAMEQTWMNLPDYTWSSPWRWSADSQYLAYVGYTSAESLDDPYLGIIAMNGSKRVVDLSLLPQKPLGIVIHNWSADNQYLAFGVTYRSPDPYKTVWVWNVDSTSADLTNIEIPYDTPHGMGTWTPTGHQLVVLGQSPNSYEYHLTLWSPEQGILSQVPWPLRFGFFYRLEWSPDGTHLISRDEHLERAEFDIVMGYANNQLIVATDKITRSLFPTEDSIYAHSMRVQAWFDNGDALIDYANHTHSENDALVRLNMNTNVDEILQSHIDTVAPSPNGRSTLFSYELDGQYVIDILDSTGSRKRFLTLDDVSFGSPYTLWSADARYVAILGGVYGTVKPHTIIVSADGQQRWDIMGVDFFWVGADWLVYTKIADAEQTVQLLNLKKSQTFDMGKITLEVPIPYASLSPDEKKIAFRSGEHEMSFYFLEDGHTQTITASNLWKPNPIGGVANGSQRYYDYDRTPSWLKERVVWSPDSAYLAYWGFTDSRTLFNVIAVDHFQTKQQYTYDLGSAYRGDFSLSWTQCGQ